MTLAVRLALIGAGAVEAIAQWWPFAVGTEVLAVMPTDVICQTNPSDPGPFTTDLVVADLTAGFFPSINSQPNTLGWWIFQKALYALFVQACDCPAAEPAPPQPVAPNFPTTGQPYPPGNDNQPQLNRIEFNQNVANNGQTTLYKGIYYSTAYGAETWQRSVQSYAQQSGIVQDWTATGEGSRDLIGVPFNNPQIQDVFGVVAEVTAIPPTVKQRGTVTPRLYGVGSVYWDSAQGGGPLPKIVVQRDSIHYWTHFLWAPQHSHVYTLWWYLQPGVTVNFHQVQRGVDAPHFTPDAPNYAAIQNMHGLAMPGGVSDPPFWPPAAARRVFALGSPP